MKSLISSNFNLNQKNSAWSNLKKKEDYDFDDFNNISFSLNNKKTLVRYNNFYIILYVNDLLENKNDLSTLLNSIKKKAKEYQNKNFAILLLRKNNNSGSLDQKNTISFFKSFQNFHKTAKNLKIIEITTKIHDFNLRNQYFLRFPFEIKIIKLFAKEINNIKNINSNKPYKLIILDCDNTLWGGVAAEDGIKSIQYGEDGEGKIYEDVQKHLKYLKSQGCLLALASKNDEKIVWETLKQRKMVLKKNDFICSKINWKPKEQNIKDMLDHLSIRSEDVIFIDDSEVEIKKVKNYIEKINTYKINDIIKYLDFIFNCKKLQFNSSIKEDKKKSFQYKIKNKYENLKKKINSDKIYNSLEQKISTLNVTQNNFGRTLQLFNKTNQFNFSTNRYQTKDLENILNSKHKQIKLIKFIDKFGDHGIIGLYVLNFKKKKIIIEDFIMSCRVINRKIEEFILLDILKKYQEKFNIFLNFIANNNNRNILGNFLKNSFFLLSAQTNKLKIYKLLLNKDLNNVTKFFKK